MNCNLDPVNYCCWTHGIDITEADYIEGCCAVGWAEQDAECDEEDYDPAECDTPQRKEQER